MFSDPNFGDRLRQETEGAPDTSQTFTQWPEFSSGEAGWFWKWGWPYRGVNWVTCSLQGFPSALREREDGDKFSESINLALTSDSPTFLGTNSSWSFHHFEPHLPQEELNFVSDWSSVQSVQSLSCVWLFATPWTAACQASLSITNSWSLPKLMSIESVMPSNHLHPLSSPSPPTFNLSQHQGLFKWVSSSHQVTKVLEFQLQHQSF